MAGFAAASAWAQDKPADHPAKADEVHLPNCPVSGEPIDFLSAIETDEGPVYFCCKMCMKKY
ncbi:MAG: hypothetical protein D6744_11455, partial [Planctomycetota bacterium]